MYNDMHADSRSGGVGAVYSGALTIKKKRRVREVVQEGILALLLPGQGAVHALLIVAEQD
jgi:hypothetical protein